MNELSPEQQVRFDCILTAFKTYNTMIENGIEPTVSPYEISEQMFVYVFERKIPTDSSLN